MGTVRYTVLDGEMIAQTEGGTRHQYVPDPQGSVVALYDGGGAKTDAFEYWPYGEDASRVGSTEVRFQYAGCAGYMKAGLLYYVKNRYLSPSETRWLSRDSLNMRMTTESYCHSNPISYIDTNGLQPTRQPRPRNEWFDNFNHPPFFSPEEIDRGINICMGQINCLLQSYKDAMGFAGEAQKAFHIPQQVGTIGGAKDAIYHCVGSCLINRLCGFEAYFYVSQFHEAINAGEIDDRINNLLRPINGVLRRIGLEPILWPEGRWDPVNGPMDLHNNEQGRKCAGKLSAEFTDRSSARGVCYRCCLNKWEDGKLAWY